MHPIMAAAAAGFRIVNLASYQYFQYFSKMSKYIKIYRNISKHLKTLNLIETPKITI